MHVKFLEDCEIDTAIEFEKDGVFKEGKVYELNDASAVYWNSTSKAKLVDAPEKAAPKKKAKKKLSIRK